MHELSLAKDMVEQIIATAQQEQALRVDRVVVAIGAYSGVEREAFAFAFPFAAENTIAENAQLVIEETCATAVCDQCGAVISPETGKLHCSLCGSGNISLHGGREFLIRSIDLEIP